MKEILRYIRNRWKQFTNRKFLSTTSNNIFWYSHLNTYVSNVEYFLEKIYRLDDASIVMVSNDVLAKIIMFLYCLITNTKLAMVSPSVNFTALINAVTSRRASILLVDANILFAIKTYEENEEVQVLKYFKHVVATNEFIDKVVHDKPINMNRLYKKGLQRIDSIGYITVLSPGTSNEPCFTKIPFAVLFKSARLASYFLGLKPEDRFSVIGEFDSYPGLFSLLGVISGAELVQPSSEIHSLEQYEDEFEGCKQKPTVVLIDSYRFKEIWDGVLLKVYSNRFMMWLSKIRLLERIPEIFVLKELVKLFGVGTKVHILNEELGLHCLGILRRTKKILFTSSYGFVEQGNFLAFKDPELFKHKSYYGKPGGTLLRDSPDFFDEVTKKSTESFTSLGYVKAGIVTVTSKLDEVTDWEMNSEDVGVNIPNTRNQGSRPFLYILTRIRRYSPSIVNTTLSLIEKAVKDTLLVRDCLFILFDGKLVVYIEPRKEICDIHSVAWEEIVALVQMLISDLNKDNKLEIKRYGIIEFKGLRNAAGKVQLYYNP